MGNFSERRHYRQPAAELLSWESRDSDRDDVDSSIIDMMSAYRRNARAEPYPRPAGLIKATGPDAMFLTCADARIMPDVITASGPGDLYIVRNVGNLVPTEPADQSVNAALDIAFNQLGVRSFVVCGHSSCSAMDELIADATDRSPSAVGHWLEYAHDSLAAFRNHHPARASAQADGLSETDQLSIANVAVQLERLTRNPILNPAKASGALKVYGMFFDIATARVYEVNQNGIVRPAEPAATP